MTKEEYIRRFDLAAIYCRDFGQRFVIERLPEIIRFDIPFGLTGKEVGKIKFLGGRLLAPEELKSMEYIKARTILWIDGKVPCWINMHVCRIEGDATIIQIELAHDLTNDDSKLYHKREGNPPFHVLGPMVPYGTYTRAENGKISLGEITKDN